MVHVRVLFTFLGTGSTDFCTEFANLVGKFTSASHCLYGQQANGSAVMIQLDATGEHFNVLLIQASTCTVITFYCTR
jgi:hypothetical protein